jgi:uncharacterized protein (TIGR02246 family)
MTVAKPNHINDAFASAFNDRNMEGLAALYEPDAILCADETGTRLSGLEAIKAALQQLMQVPGKMVARNHFCIQHDDLALLRADWELVTEDGSLVASGSSAELVRRQSDGSWRYVIDHATGASLPRLA